MASIIGIVRYTIHQYLQGKQTQTLQTVVNQSVLTLQPKSGDLHLNTVVKAVVLLHVCLHSTLAILNGFSFYHCLE